MTGCGSRMQSHTFICENVTVGENCFIGHNVTSANDPFHQGAPPPDNWIKICQGNGVTNGRQPYETTSIIYRLTPPLSRHVPARISRADL